MGERQLGKVDLDFLEQVFGWLTKAGRKDLAYDQLEKAVRQALQEQEELRQFFDGATDQEREALIKDMSPRDFYFFAQGAKWMDRLHREKRIEDREAGEVRGATTDRKAKKDNYRIPISKPALKAAITRHRRRDGLLKGQPNWSKIGVDLECDADTAKSRAIDYGLYKLK